MPHISVFASQENEFLVNSFLIETRRGIVLVDTQFLISSSQRLCQMIKALGRPLLAIVITHPHPDHFNGLAEIDREWPDLPIYATQTTIDTIQATAADKRAAWTPVYGRDYPQQTLLPNTIVQGGQLVEVDGLEFTVDDLGAGESADITVIHFPKSGELIASDLLYNRVHPWLAEGRTAEWLTQLDTVLDRYGSASTVYAGHGEAGGIEALKQQADYLHTFREAVRSGVTDFARVTAEEKSRISNDIINLYQGYPLEMLVAMNVDGVAREFATRTAQRAS